MLTIEPRTNYSFELTIQFHRNVCFLHVHSRLQALPYTTQRYVPNEEEWPYI